MITYYFQEAEFANVVLAAGYARGALKHSWSLQHGFEGPSVGFKTFWKDRDLATAWFNTVRDKDRIMLGGTTFLLMEIDTEKHTLTVFRRFKKLPAQHHKIVTKKKGTKHG